MARKHLIRTSDFPYHVMGRTNNKEWFHVSMDECWPIFEHELSEISQKYAAQISSFVLMSNHFHMILWTPNENLDKIMHHLMRQVSKKINRLAGRTNHLFGARYKWSLIKNKNYLAHVYRYVYQNPMNAGIVQKNEEYQYSTLYKIYNNQKLKFPIYDKQIIEYANLPNDEQQRLDWLNTPYTEEQRQMLSRCLKRTTFVLPTHHKFKKTISTMSRSNLVTL